MDKIDLLEIIELTPEKTQVVRKGNSIRIKHIGKKGKVARREQCNSCSYLDKYQAGLGFAILPCCSREDGWREMWGNTTRKCKAYKPKAEES
jgi:hypothetical protein